MQRNRGNFNWAGRSSLTPEEKILVEQQQQMLRIMSINQGLASLPTQPHVSFSSFPLLAPMGNLLQAGQMSSLVTAAGMLPRPALLTTPSMVIPPEIPPAPSMVPPPAAQFASSSNFKSQKSSVNNSKSTFFSSRSGSRDERDNGNSRFDSMKDSDRKWDGRRWNLSEQRIEEDRSLRPRQEERSWSKPSQEDNGGERGGSSRDWHNLTEGRKSTINPWAQDERRNERSGEWNRESNERARELDRSWNFKSQEFQSENRNIARSFLDDKRVKTTENDERFDRERINREPERAKGLAEQKWNSKDNPFDDKMWGQERQRDSDESRSTKERIWSKEAKVVNSWSVKGLKEEKSLSNLSSAEEDIRAKRHKEEEGHSLYKQPKMSGESWFSNSKQSEGDVWTKDYRKSEGDNWNSKSAVPKDVWSKTLNENRDTSWTNRLEGSEEESWKTKSKDIWSDKSKSSGQDSTTRSLPSGDSKKSNLWTDRPRNEDQHPTSRNDNHGSKWFEKPKNLTEQNWQRKDSDGNEYRGVSSRDNEEQTLINNEKLTRTIEHRQNKWSIDRESNENMASNPPSNFLYPDPCKKSTDVWSRLSSITTEDRPDCLETLRSEENRGHQINRGDWDDGWEGEMILGRNVAAVQETTLALKVGYLDSQLERLDHRMMQLDNISSTLPQNEELLPSVWENQRSSEVWPSYSENKSSLPATTDLRITLQKKAEASNVGGTANSDLGGWTEDMVLIYPFIRHTHLSGADISELKTLLSQRIHNLLTMDNPDIQPRFLGVGPVCDNWFMVHCGDNESLEWMLTWKPTLITKKRMNLCVRRAVDAVRVTHIEIYLQGVSDSVKEIESRLHAQNKHLETIMWRRANYNASRSGITLGFLVDNACLKLLEANGWRLYYELSKVKVSVVEHKPVPRLIINKKRRI